MPNGVTVKQAITILETLEPDRLIVLSSDEEGNEYRPMTSFFTGLYDPEYREIHMETLTEEDRKHGYTEEDLGDPDTDTKVVVLW